MFTGRSKLLRQLKVQLQAVQMKRYVRNSIFGTSFGITWGSISSADDGYGFVLSCTNHCIINVLMQSGVGEALEIEHDWWSVQNNDFGTYNDVSKCLAGFWSNIRTWVRNSVGYISTANYGIFGEFIACYKIDGLWWQRFLI